jgi:SAM-dependent methyltransferase
MSNSDLATLGGITLATMVLAWTLVVYLRVGAPSLSSSGAATRAMVNMLAPRAGWTVYELGCGTGTVAAEIVARHTHVRVVGFELAPLPWLLARLRAWWLGGQRFSVRYADFRRVPLEQADAVILYLSHEAMGALAKKLRRELKEGTPVVVNSFALPGWPITREERADDLHGSRLILYQAPGPATDEAS